MINEIVDEFFNQGKNMSMKFDEIDSESKVVVLGSGYAGTSAVQRLEKFAPSGIDIKWISDDDYHLVLHESHRVISNPDVQNKIKIPISRIKSERTDFTKSEVKKVKSESKEVILEDGKRVDYDYLIIGLGSETNFFGIEGLEENALKLKSSEDALKINRELRNSVRDQDTSDVLIGGAGLTGIQIAGEICELEKQIEGSFNIKLIEGLDNVYPGNKRKIQRKLRSRLENKGVDIHTGSFVESVDFDKIYFEDNNNNMEYDVLIWSGGIKGSAPCYNSDLNIEDNSKRIEVNQYLNSSDEDVFVAGDSAYLEKDNELIPAKAQMAWDAGDIVADNVLRKETNNNLREFRSKDKGTVISIGEDAVAHDLKPIPFVNNLTGKPAVALKKSISSYWISTITNPEDGLKSWSDM